MKIGLISILLTLIICIAVLIALFYPRWVQSERIQDQCYAEVIKASKVWSDQSLLQSNPLYKQCLLRKGEQ